MGHTKISVTIPDEMYNEIKAFALKKKIKLSHLVADALAEKARKIKEDEITQKINEVFSDPNVAQEQISIANMIAENTDVEELPW